MHKPISVVCINCKKGCKSGKPIGCHAVKRGRTETMQCRGDFALVTSERNGWGRPLHVTVREKKEGSGVYTAYGD